ncbi:MAG: TMEM165/GDT1 family protein [Planctomycetes bacterium]|nr:TMEM165/GDT1 family protein [Planctomycetota bacterium]
MDWKTLSAAFAMVFLAELGDKTQIALFTMTAQGKPRGAVLLGGCLALCASTVLAVALGSLLQGAVGEGFRKWIRLAAGAAFVVMGLLMLLGKDD